MTNWVTRIDKTTEDFVNLFGSLTTEQLNWKPNSQTWSIAQNIDHLRTVNETYFPILSALEDGTYQLPFIAKFGFIVSLLGKTVLKGVQPDRRRKTKTFSIWEPSASQFSSDILDKFKDHQTRLKKRIADSEDLVKRGAVISSPVNRNIVYKLEAAFDIIVAHEQRHLEQAKEILGQIEKNADAQLGK